MKTVGIIGYGNMGSAIAERIKKTYLVYVFEKDKSKIRDLSGINVAVDIEDLLNRAANIILAVKPQDFELALLQVKNRVRAKLVISIAAGIPTEYIEKKIGNVRIIRAMPNLPVKVGRGMICFCKGKYAFAGDIKFAEELFGHMGNTMLVEENLMDAVTAVSGSGPGYFYAMLKDKQSGELEGYSKKIFIPQLSSAAQKIGFDKEQADILAKGTAEGSIALLKETGVSAEVLCSQVCSRGGTTEAGLAVLRISGSLDEAVEAALKKAKDLAKKE